MGGIPLEKEGKERLDLNPDNGRESGCLLVIIMIMRYNNPAARGILGKMSAPSDSKNCPRTVDCAAVEVRGQFLESRGRTFFPVCRVLPGYYNIITRELRFHNTGP